MAQKIITRLVDDLDGTEVADGKGATIDFAFDGVAYQIDLSDKNAKAFRQLIDPYTSAARRTQSSQRGSARRAGSQNANRDYDPKAVRVWASENGIEVPARGRIPADVLEKYQAR